MPITGVVAAVFFFALGYWLMAHRGSFWLGIFCFIIVGATLAGTAVGSGLSSRAILAVNGLYNFGVSLVHG